MVHAAVVLSSSRPAILFPTLPRSPWPPTMANVPITPSSRHVPLLPFHSVPVGPGTNTDGVADFGAEPHGRLPSHAEMGLPTAPPIIDLTTDASDEETPGEHHVQGPLCMPPGWIDTRLTWNPSPAMYELWLHLQHLFPRLPPRVVRPGGWITVDTLLDQGIYPPLLLLVLAWDHSLAEAAQFATWPELPSPATEAVRWRRYGLLD